ncbi:MAG: ABC transporter permease subunit [Alphaproteobacteria bacterium]|uniref:Putative spermidine/putrescine transport system permease protein n=1 Tax=Celeribacter baekdonensis TaxID=875171 RepID=A0A1G7Q8X0_9RHOB|nr:ABC transporter permease subunit [Celeribacter baekdonensis]MBU0642896.1 ABC transporter permease subunit [Alphaproteobacteria bacterium]MBU1280157.1 ABC transporter permease subunit [Alphaproteobacteria bacterium]MBU1575367.1 ABC transporter permease subunit [Alphaproteobacteria bacterium]MBU1829596.1 ABC transporter permease subunit [Alphaproteobacteria bacterium]MBU2077599.1 ABC transporter permease subunit [Alphaproteobacteria bacterium]
MSRRFPLLSTLIALAGAAFFIVPLIATFNFSLRMKRGELSFEAYRSVFDSDVFLGVLGFSATASLMAILMGVLIVVPTAYWVRLRVPRARPVIEFLSLMPLIIPPVVLVFGYVRLYGSSSILPLTMTEAGTNVLLVIGYVVLSVPYMYRAVDNGMAAIDIATLTEAAESLGASRLRTIVFVIFPNIRSAIVSGAFLTFSISLGEFVITSLLNRPAFGPYLVQMGQDFAYQPAALAIMAFAFTWICMVLMEAFATRKPGQRLLQWRAPRSVTKAKS